MSRVPPFIFAFLIRLFRFNYFSFNSFYFVLIFAFLIRFISS